MKLTKKQKEFAKEYVETGNATKSALRVYNTVDENTAGNIGCDNLKKPKIMEYLKEIATDAATRIEELSREAKNETVKLNANRDILDRAGYKPKDEVEGDINFNIGWQKKKT